MADIMVQLQRLANANTAKTFQFNREEAKTARNWQTEMSNTAHQREVKDLKAAGLNPVLSANSGAQSYSTQSASGVADSAVNAIGNVESSRNSAAATRYAANMSYKASQMMASAQAYSAQMAYAAQKYASDHRTIDNFLSNKTSTLNMKIRTEADKFIAQNKQAGNAFGLVDKYLGQPLSGVMKEWSVTKGNKYMFNNTSAKPVTQSTFHKIANSVTDKFKYNIGQALVKNGYLASDWNIAIIINAMANGKNANLSKLIRKGDHSNSGNSTFRFY